MANKQIERMYLEWFLKTNNIESHNIKDKEPPDFHMTHHNKRIGVEVTNIYNEPCPGRKGSKSRRIECIHGQWLNRLSLDYYQKSETPVAVKVILPCSEELQTDISNDVLSVLLESNKLREWEWEIYNLDIDNKAIEICLQRLPNTNGLKGYSCWTCITDHSGWVAPVTMDHITYALQKKEDKFKTYMIECDEVWLLLVIDKSWKSGMLTFDSHDFVFRDTVFDSVWLLEYPIKSYEILC
jgi:hypothetical protein